MVGAEAVLGLGAMLACGGCALLGCSGCIGSSADDVGMGRAIAGGG